MVATARGIVVAVVVVDAVAMVVGSRAFIPDPRSRITMCSMQPSSHCTAPQVEGRSFLTPGCRCDSHLGRGSLVVVPTATATSAAATFLRPLRPPLPQPPRPRQPCCGPRCHSHLGRGNFPAAAAAIATAASAAHHQVQCAAVLTMPCWFGGMPLR